VKYFSAFTGVGGFDMGMPPDWECVGHSEIDKYANMVLKYRFEDVKNYGNAEKIRWDEIPDFDVLVGGTPCQDLSISGKRAGLNGSRSRLFFEFVRALREKKPRYFVWENVKGALSSNGGWDFAKVLIEFSEAGYALWWQVLDATWFGIPQHRERVFVVGALGDEPPLKILFRPGHAGSLAGAQKIETIHRSRTQIKRIYGINGVSPTLHRYTGGHQDVKIAIPVLTPNWMEKKQDTHGIIDGKTIRILTPLECERLMGWPDGWTRYGIDAEGNTVEISDTQRYNLTGNGVVPQVVSSIMENMVIENNGGLK
jgi:DNA (cytosine-5)-methyltransferase 1